MVRHVDLPLGAACTQRAVLAARLNADAADLRVARLARIPLRPLVEPHRRAADNSSKRRPLLNDGQAANMTCRRETCFPHGFYEVRVGRRLRCRGGPLSRTLPCGKPPLVGDKVAFSILLSQESGPDNFVNNMPAGIWYRYLQEDERENW